MVLVDPEVATVGLTPVRAAEEGVALDTHRQELSKVERAFIDGEEEGFAALYTRKGAGEIVVGSGWASERQDRLETGPSFSSLTVRAYQPHYRACLDQVSGA